MNAPLASAPIVNPPGSRSIGPSATVAGLPASRIREVANSAMGRDDVLAFWFGEPADVTSPSIRDAAKASIDAGDTFYSPNLGLHVLRASLASYSSTLRPDATPIDAERIAVTSSGVSALMLAVQALVSPGDRVVVVTPVWPNLPAMPAIMNARIERVALSIDAASRRWRLDVERLLAALTSDTRLLIVNSPGNPTGWMMTAQEIARVAAHCRERGIWILSDEAYERLAFGRPRAPSFLDTCDENDALVVTNTFSKTWQMTGWRLGWLTAPPALMPAIEKLIEFNTSCAPVFVQKAGLAAIATGEGPILAFARMVESGTHALVHALRALDGVEVVEPDGAMYCLLRIEGRADSLALARQLVARAGLGLAPGIAFGAECEGWLRWCTARPVAQLLEGVARLERFLADHRD